MPRTPTPSLRTAAAATLRAWADRLDRRRPPRRRPSAAPLIRAGGQWWQRDELLGETER